MKLSETMISPAGVLRCCLAHCFDGMADDTEVELGQTIACKHCEREFTLTTGETRFTRVLSVRLAEWRPTDEDQANATTEP